MSIQIIMLEDRIVPVLGLMETGKTYSVESDLAAQLVRQGLARIGQTGNINLDDGVDDAEAALASRTLSRRKKTED